MANFPKSPPSIGRSTGLPGATGATGAAGGGIPGGWIDVTANPYNADKTGATDSSAGIQAAINACNAAGGGTVYFPPGSYHYATTLTINGMFGIALMGAGPSLQYQTGPSKLQYTGAAAQGIQIHSSSNFELSHLDFYYSNAAFTGDLIDVDGAGAGDCQDFHIHHCGSKAVGSITARSIVRLRQIVIGTIELCHWTGAVNPLRVGDTGGASGQYVNVLQIEKCTFNFATDAMIFIGTADGESITIRDCTFEAGTNTTAIRGATIARDGYSCQLYNPVIEANWLGDAGGTLVWIDGLTVQSNAYAGLMIGNRIAGGAAGSTAFNLGGKWLVISNTTEQDTVYNSPNASFFQLCEIGNTNFAMVHKFDATTFPSGQPANPYISLYCGAPGTDVIPAVARQVGVNIVSAFTYTLAIADANNHVSFNRGGGGVVLTVPTHASVAFPVGTTIQLSQNGSASAGTVTVTPAGGVTVVGAGVVPAQAGGQLTQIATDSWVLFT